ncbi:MAG: PIG-L family deacetylase [Candidatus Helarchaeota archaeon]
MKSEILKKSIENLFENGSKSYFKTLILSPHCDDAALSIGGCLLGDFFPKNIISLNVFSISRYTIFQKGNAPEKKTTGIRKKEEIMVSEQLGYFPFFLDYKEPFARSGFRNTGDVCDSHRSINSEKSYFEVKSKISEILKKFNSLICIPLSCGYHIDHRIICNIVLEFIQKINSIPIIFYEDLPYTALGKNSPSIIVKKLSKVIQLESHLFQDFSISKKIEILKFYKSQLTNSDLNLVKKYWTMIGEGERIWLNNLAKEFISLTD